MLSDLDTEERELLESYERGEWQPVRGWQEEIRRYQAAAIATLEHEGLVGVNLKPQDLEEIQRQAQEAGIPYQVFIADIIHRFVMGELVSK